jgi:hypothetical protein
MANPLTIITNLKSWKSGKNALHQGVVKRDWFPTGRIDFATKLNSNDDPNQPNEFKLLVEERRIIESVAGNEHLKIQWRLATLKEAKAVVTQYHKFLKENSLVKSVSDPEILPLESRDSGAPSEVATAAPQSLAHMKFFLPVQETKIAEESYQAIKKFIEKQTGWPISDGRSTERTHLTAAMALSRTVRCIIFSGRKRCQTLASAKVAPVPFRRGFPRDRASRFNYPSKRKAGGRNTCGRLSDAAAADVA